MVPYDILSWECIALKILLLIANVFKVINIIASTVGFWLLVNINGDEEIKKPTRIWINLRFDSAVSNFKFNINSLLITKNDIIPKSKMQVYHSLIKGIQIGKFIHKIIYSISKWQCFKIDKSIINFHIKYEV